MSSQALRSPLIDVLKGLACATIVWHHLAFYGPMSDVALPLFPDLMAWLYDHGRLAVQVFLVLGGFLAAGSLAPEGHARFDSAWALAGRRFVRLAIPYAAALAVALAAAALVRPWLDHPSVPGVPEWPQLLAHALLLQDVVGEEALSAGVWYVAIDFQLFVLAALLLAAVRRTGLPAAAQARLTRALVTGGVAASLLYFNRQPALDVWGVYFFGAYGLGMLARWTVRAPQPGWGLAGMALLAGAALALDFRSRIAVAALTALALVLLLRHAPAWPTGRLAGGLQRVGQMSYSVFLVHFSVCLVVNAVFAHLWPDDSVANALGMGLAFGLALAAGRVLYLRVERRTPSWTQALRWQAGMLGMGLLAFKASAFL
ncbi:MAG: acyltransferase [Burkholderiales bacterium 68-12]|nr:MAG: acyltransferase [Burkholderiales bacterium 68-12]